jgi:hypothetical protein
MKWTWRIARVAGIGRPHPVVGIDRKLLEILNFSIVSTILSGLGSRHDFSRAQRVSDSMHDNKK